jgi:hypothetical protein
MKYAITAVLTLTFLFSADAIAETYITYDDGGVYTLAEGESVYVADRDVFIKRTPANGDVNFEKQDPFTEVDYQEPPVVVEPVEAPVGSHEWCLVFEPWANGLTFDQVTFNYSCDTNRDGKYGCGDAKFDASEEGEVCSP